MATKGAFVLGEYFFGCGEGVWAFGEISPSFAMAPVGKLVVDGSSRLGGGYFFSWLSC